MHLTEQQRKSALEACDRIIAANQRLQAIAAEIKRGADKLLERRTVTIRDIGPVDS